MPHEPMMPKLIHTIRPYFDQLSISDPARSKISMADILFSGLAIFSFKFPSLLQYDKGRNTHVIAHSMKSLYGIKYLPCDTYMRERLDDIDADQLKPTFKSLFAFAQRRKLLEPYTYLNGKYLLSLDGSGMFSSKDVSCKHCCVKNHRDGTQTFYHQVLQGAIVHPDIKQVIPLAPEMIYRKDGAEKNGAENNSSKRWVKQFRKDHPCLDVTVVADALHATEPAITRFATHNISFILNVKPKSHKYLFEWVDKSACTEFEKSLPDGTVRRYRFLNDAPLNCQNDDVRVNFLEYWETNPKGKVRHFSWVTDFELRKGNCYDIMRGGRARWKIENETFNTLKNQGYEFEHNFGHGKNNLSHVFAHLILLAFLMDQLVAIGCSHFKDALKVRERPLYFWNAVRAQVLMLAIPSWEAFYGILARTIQVEARFIFDTS